MKIGMTYDLREDYLAEGFSEEATAEFDKPETIAAIESALQELGHQTDRIGNIRSLAARLVAGNRWDMVFNIAEGLQGFGREALVPALLDAYGIPYTFSDPMVLSLTLHKGMTKRVVRDLGVPTPDFFVWEKGTSANGQGFDFPLFAKPVAEGTGKGITARSKISSQKELAAVCNSLAETFKQPVLVEAFLPGREFTVGILGSGSEAVAIGVMEVVLNKDAEAEVYSYHNKEHYKKLLEYLLVEDALAEKAKQVALDAWRGLGCLDGGRIDLRTDKNGIPNFLEVNPLAGLHPQNSDLCILAYKAGMTYKALIGAIVSSAVKRYFPG
ncbi:MAG: D-alanine--D-alanine ligase [Thermodesulfobacteriota bacterium]